MSDFALRSEFDAHVVAHADCFCATAFRGKGRYDKSLAPTLEAARLGAEALYEDRPVAIYALMGDRQVHVENWAPYPLAYPYRSK